MIYSSRHSFLLVEIPYTGSAVLREAFGRHGNLPGWRSVVAGSLAAACPPLGRGVFAAWGTFREFLPLKGAQMLLPAEDFAHCYKFTFVRNPFDRVVLMYQTIVGDRRHRLHRLVSSFRDFGEMVANLSVIAEPSMTSYLRGLDGGVQTNFVGRIENFEQDFDAVCRRLGIDEQGARAVALARYHAGYRPVTDLVEGVLGLDEVHPWNPSDVAQGQVAGHWRAEYTAESRDQVFEYYREDFDNFGYLSALPGVGW